MVFLYNNNIFTYFKAVTLVAVFFLTLLLQNLLSILMDHVQLKDGRLLLQKQYLQPTTEFTAYRPLSPNRE